MSGITVRGISKSYGEVKALDNISFEVKKGELFGLIGPDGAGKSSLFRILTTALLPDSGEAMVADHPLTDYKSIRKIVGYMPGRFSLYQDLSVQENLEFFATVFGTTIEANYETIKDIYVQLEPFKNRRAGKLSGGMKQKLALCCALIHQPVVLFLDEPTTGVDPVSRKDFWDNLQLLKAKGITILVSTAYMDEAAQCDRVALIQKGKILTIDTPRDIPKSFERTLFAIRGKGLYHVLKALEKFPHVRSIYLSGDELHYVDERELADISGLQAFLEKQDLEADVIPVQPEVEDCFIDLMKRQEMEEKTKIQAS